MSDEEDFDDDEEESDEVGAMQGAPVGGGVSPTWTWGSSAEVRADNSSTTGPPPYFLRQVTAQLAQISLPEPAVCTLYFQASMTTAFPDDTIRSLTLNLLEGVGRVTIPRQVSFMAQPSPGSPLEFTIPFVPLHALQVDITVGVDLQHAAGSLITVQTYFVLSPLTRIPQKEQKLAFGMALPGEADDLDDELRQDLEAEGPTAAQAVAQGRQRVDKSNDHVEGADPDEDDDGEDDEQQVQRVHPVLLKLIDQLTARHGRQPTKTELRAAVARFKARRRRQAARGR